jgi:hypothetical protein
MSCGSPHELDCAEVLRRAELFLEHTLDLDAAGATHLRASVSYHRIEEHLHECHPCEAEVAGAVFQLDEGIRAAMVRCCHEDHASADLRDRILQRLEQLRADPRSGLLG